MDLSALGEQWSEAQDAFPRLIEIGISVFAAITIFFVGITVARWIRSRLRNSKFGGQRIDATLRPVIASIVFYFVLAFTLYAVLTKLGVPSHALLAVFGSAGLAIGLALKDTLGNIASGVMLLVLHPLKVGEYVEAPNFLGTVQEIGLFSTTLKTPDGLYIYIPNGQVWNNRLQNNARHTERRLAIDIGVAYDSDLGAVKDIMLGVMRETPGVQDGPAAPECFVMGFGDSAINMSARCWLPGTDWLAVSSDARLRMKTALDAAKIEIPFPHRVLVTKT